MDQVSLARVSVVAPVCSRSTAAAAADGASPTTVPPSSTQAAARARMAVVFPAPAGAMASWSRAPEVAIWVTRAACPALRVAPLAACSSSAISTASGWRVCRSARPAASTRRCSAARICGAGVDGGAGDLVHAGPSTRRSSAGSSMPSPAGVSRTEAVVEGVVGDQVHDRRRRARRAGSRRGPGACASARTCQTCQVERRACISSRTRVRGVPHPRRIHGRWLVPRGRRTGPWRTMAATPCGAAEDLLGLLAPGGALLGQGARFVLGVAGLQGGLLGQLDRLHHGRRAPVVGLERGGELAAAGLDAGPPGGPALVQGRVDTDDLADRALAAVGAGTLREDQPEPGRAGASPGRCCRSRRR